MTRKSLDKISAMNARKAAIFAGASPIVEYLCQFELLTLTEEEFNSIWSIYDSSENRGKLFALAKGFLSEEDAEDAVSTTYTRIFEGVMEGKFPYLTMQLFRDRTVNECKSAFRCLKNRASREIKGFESEALEAMSLSSLESKTSEYGLSESYVIFLFIKNLKILIYKIFPREGFTYWVTVCLSTLYCSLQHAIEISHQDTLASIDIVQIKSFQDLINNHKSTKLSLLNETEALCFEAASLNTDPLENTKQVGEILGESPNTIAFRLSSVRAKCNTNLQDLKESI